MVMMGHDGRRRMVIAILILGIAAIVLVLWLLLRGSSQPEVPQTQDRLPEPAQTVRDIPEAPVVVATPGEASAQVVVRNFVERFGTYSTDLPYQNFDDVDDLVTTGYSAILDANRSADTSDVYRGVTTRVLSMTQTSGTEAQGRITFQVNAQRESAGEARSQKEVTYANGEIVVVKVGNSWLVDAFSWQ